MRGRFSEARAILCFASGVGLGAILSQEQEDGTIHPVAYASRSLVKHENLRAGDPWLVVGCALFPPVYFRTPLYCVYRPCGLLVDLNTEKPPGKLARWALTIQEMDLTIKHKPGKANSNADTLSRNVAVVNSVTTSDRGG